MEKSRAKKFAKEVEGQTCSGWVIQDYIGCGKSAIVMKATKGDQLAAVKIFDPELVERYGAEVQAKRIEREKSLIGHSHPNLIQILDGGRWKGKEREYYFVAMEYLPWPNLADVLGEVPPGRERDIIGQVAAAARFLEGLSICHRDIKPENIGISNDFQKVKLLDLGVIKPHGAKSLTDGSHGKHFVGTLRYSPPEFLLGKEKDDAQDWRAISFYQLGGVLHDLIMRRPLFAEFENPFALLVNAIQDTKPEIESKSVSLALVELARYCLIKNPATRLQLVSWDAFEKEPEVNDTLADIKSRISRRAYASAQPAVSERGNKAEADRMKEYIAGITSICRVECIGNSSIFPPIEIRQSVAGEQSWCVVVQFDPSSAHGLNHHLQVVIQLRWMDAESDVVEVAVAAFTSGSAFPAKSPVVNNAVPIYCGAFAADSIRGKALSALYGALDQAQQSKKPTKGDTAVHQLNMEESLK